MIDPYDHILQGVCWTIPATPYFNIWRHISSASLSIEEVGILIPELDLNDMELEMLKQIMEM